MPDWSAVASLRPMLATLAESPEDQLSLRGFGYEPKYDGIRALIHLQPAPRGGSGGRRDAHVRLWSRLGNEKTAQFPEVVQSLARFGRSLEAPVLVDGELVALDSRGEPAGFQRLQGRIHLTREADIERVRTGQPVAFIVFDLLWHGNEDLRGLPLSQRRARLEKLFAAASRRDPLIRVSELANDGHALYQRAL
ncbi:MAG: hypothetical protein HY654_02720, partial [Acidobacteria bacterium]|nr:hypothetical protein [Acidobacteriota bacterium]